VWPAADGRQNATQHLDIAVADLDEAVQWALNAGAVLADVQPQEAVRVMLDPAGAPVLPVLAISPSLTRLAVRGLGKRITQVLLTLWIGVATPRQKMSIVRA
jgi:hypothetical protein